MWNGYVFSYLLARYATNHIIVEADMEIMNFKQPTCQSAVKYAQELWMKALHYGPLSDEFHPKGTFGEALEKAIGKYVRSNWPKNRSALLREHACHAPALENLQCGSPTPKSGLINPLLTNSFRRNACSIVNFESESSFETWVDWVNHGTLMQQQLRRRLQNGWRPCPTTHQQTWHWLQQNLIELL